MLYNEAFFAEMKKDIAALKITASDIKSVTIGINVNERFEAVSMGLVSVNDKPFKKSGIISNFADAISSKDKIQSGTEWNGDMHYHMVEQEKDRIMRYAIIEHDPFWQIKCFPSKIYSVQILRRKNYA